MIKLWSTDIYILTLYENRSLQPVLRISKRSLLRMCQWYMIISEVAIFDVHTVFLQTEVWAFSFYPVQLPKHLSAEPGWVWGLWESSVMVGWSPCQPWRWWVDSWRPLASTLRTSFALGAWSALLGHFWGHQEHINKTEYAKFCFLCIAVVKGVWGMEGAAVCGDCWLHSQHVSNQS